MSCGHKVDFLRGHLPVINQILAKKDNSADYLSIEHLIIRQEWYRPQAA